MSKSFLTTRRSALSSAHRRHFSCWPVSSLALACAATLLAAQSARAVSFEWDTNTTDFGAQGGAGMWSTDPTALNFWDGFGNVAWPTSGVDNDAIFGGTGGAVTLGDVSVNDLTFNSDGYSLSGGTLNVIASGTSQTVLFTVATGVGTTIESRIAAPFDVSKRGTGTLTLSGGTAETPSTFRQLFATAGVLNLTGFHNIGTKFVTNGGTVNWSGTGTASGSYLGAGDGGSGIINVIGGSLTTNPTSGVFVGNAGTAGFGELNVSAGTFTLSSNVSFLVGSGYNNSQSGTKGTVTISGTGLLTTGTTTGAFQLGNNGGTATLNLDGGTLATSRSITRGTGTNGGSATGTLNFNGGILRANGNNTNFINGLTAANVRNGGAVIDTGTFSVTLPQALQHSTILDDNAIDGGLTKNGAGTLTLSGANTYTGGTLINSGTLIATQAAALPGHTVAGEVTVAGGATLVVRAGGAGEWAANEIDALQAGNNGSFEAGSSLGIEVTGTNSFSYASAVADGAGSRGFVKLGTGTLVLSGTSSYTGPTLISSGVLSVGTLANGGANSAIGAATSDSLNLKIDGGTLSYTGATAAANRGFSISSGKTGTIEVAASDTILTLSGDVFGTGGNFTKTGAGTLRLTGENIFWNQTNPRAGTLEFDLGQNGFFSSTGKFAMNAPETAVMNWKSGTGLIASNDYIALGDNAAGNATVNVTGGSLSFVNTAFRLLIGNTGTAAVNVSGGELIIGGGGSNVAAIIGGDIQYDATNATGSLTVSGTGKVVINGTAPLMLGNNTGAKTGANGTINLDGGSLETARPITRGNGSATVNFNGGTLRAGASSETFLQGLTAANVKAGGAVVDTNGFDISINQDLLHDTNLGATLDGGLVKTGEGTLTAGGASTYTGVTSVNAGALLVTGSLTGTAKVDVSGILGGTGTIQPAAGALGDINVLAGGKLSPGVNGAGTLSLTFTGGALKLSTGIAAGNSAALLFDLGVPGASDKVFLTGGALNIGTGVLGFGDFVFTSIEGFDPAGTYTLFDGDTPLIGSLGTDVAGLIGGQPFELQLADGGRDLVLTSVPEPGSAMLVLMGAGAVLGLRRRRK